MSDLKALVVGYGSIGSRHARLLKTLCKEVAVVSKRAVEFQPLFATLDQAVSSFKPDYVVIANNTSEHRDTLEHLARLGFDGTVLVEKPLFRDARPLVTHRFKKVWVGYNLRFHPVLQRLRTLLQGKKAVSIQCYVGKYMPGWRPDTPYQQSYSSRKEAGGGVLRDLSHELDFINWLVGPWQELAARGGRFGSLEIDSEDTFCILMSLSNCTVATIHLNYLDHTPKREVIVVGNDFSFKADLMNHTLEVNGVIERFESDRDSTYLLQHQAVLAGESKNLCSAEEGLGIMHMIETCEKASEERRWLKR